MKRRYNHETKQWDIVLTQDEYANIQRELVQLNLLRMEQSRFPIGRSIPYPPNPFQPNIIYGGLSTNEPPLLKPNPLMNNTGIQ
jgi:hypothetical protein